MKLNRHFDLEGQHAFLAPSTHSWLNYDEDKLAKTWRTKRAAALGDRLHRFASEAISLKLKQPESRKTMNQYINDAIGFKMIPEQPLFYSYNIFGTTDAISYRLIDGVWVLRIHDLKTGTTRTSMDQLIIYAALFCLEYGVNPSEITIILRIYKSDAIEELIPDLVDVVRAMSVIVQHDKLIEILKAEDAE